MIEARSDTHLWSETYDRTLDDIFAIQDEISAAIVGELVNRLRGDEDATYRYLEEGFDHKASMSFEVYSAHAIFDSLHWNTHPRFGPLIDAHEAYNQTQLKELFTKACAGAYSGWVPLESSCARYVKNMGSE